MNNRFFPGPVSQAPRNLAPGPRGGPGTREPGTRENQDQAKADPGAGTGNLDTQEPGLGFRCGRGLVPVRKNKTPAATAR
ncbi:hypothetical protein [Desulforamulus ruminis]|uniref:hypothetical protein n=1 Tax=Desulforamulus ruminis TaxID=1564 RepID=UPI0002E6C61C|nr:hypothetical protein [Desulforamulus ruminis]